MTEGGFDFRGHPDDDGPSSLALNSPDIARTSG
jgi:hypothetical protein